MRVAAPLSKVDFGSRHCYVSYSGFHDKALYRYLIAIEQGCAFSLTIIYFETWRSEYK